LNSVPTLSNTSFTDSSIQVAELNDQFSHCGLPGWSCNASWLQGGQGNHLRKPDEVMDDFWLVVWNMNGLFSISYMGCHPNPIDELHHFSEG
jgi:hypothetical protein